MNRPSLVLALSAVASLAACPAPSPSARVAAPPPSAALSVAAPPPVRSEEPVRACTPRKGPPPTVDPVGTCDATILEGAPAARFAALVVGARGPRGKSFEVVAKQACGGKLTETTRLEPDAMPSGTIESDVWVTEGGKQLRVPGGTLLGAFDFDGDGTAEAIVRETLPADRAWLAEAKSKVTVYFAGGPVSVTIPHAVTDTLEVVGEGKRSVLLLRRGQTTVNAELYSGEDFRVYPFAPQGTVTARAPLAGSPLAALTTHCPTYDAPAPAVSIPAPPAPTPAAAFVAGLARPCAALSAEDQTTLVKDLQSKLGAEFRARGSSAADDASEEGTAEAPLPFPEVTVTVGCVTPGGTLVGVFYDEAAMTSVSELWRRGPDGALRREVALRGLVGSEWYHRYTVAPGGLFLRAGESAPEPVVTVSLHEVGSLETMTHYYAWTSGGPVLLGRADVPIAFVARPAGDLLVALPTAKVAPWTTPLETAAILPWSERSLTVLAPKPAPKGALSALIAATASARGALPRP